MTDDPVWQVTVWYSDRPPREQWWTRVAVAAPDNLEAELAAMQMVMSDGRHAVRALTVDWPTSVVSQRMSTNDLTDRRSCPTILPADELCPEPANPRVTTPQTTR